MYTIFIFSQSPLNFPWLSFAITYSSQLCSWLVKFLGYKTETHKISFIEFYISFYFILFLLAERLRNALNRGMNQEFDRRTSRELNEAVPQTEILGIVSLNLNWLGSSLSRWLVPNCLSLVRIILFTGPWSLYN